MSVVRKVKEEMNEFGFRGKITVTKTLKKLKFLNVFGIFACFFLVLR